MFDIEVRKKHIVNSDGAISGFDNFIFFFKHEDIHSYCFYTYHL